MFGQVWVMMIDFEVFYIDLYQYLEFLFQEMCIVGIVVQYLCDLGFEVEEGVGVIGVVGVLCNGDGLVVWVWVDMDVLLVEEQMGLVYVSIVKGVDFVGMIVFVMYVCGYDMYVIVMIGVVERFVVECDEWMGMFVVLIQFVEEYGVGVCVMFDDGIFDCYLKFDVVFGQYVILFFVGVIGVCSGMQMVVFDGFIVILYGCGGYGLCFYVMIDFVVMVVVIVMCLQIIVLCEIDLQGVVVVMVGFIYVGLKNNIIFVEVKFEFSLCYLNEEVCEKVFMSVECIVWVEVMVLGVECEFEICIDYMFFVMINDDEVMVWVFVVLQCVFGEVVVIDFGMFIGSEDVLWFVWDVGVLLVFWFWGGVDLVWFVEVVFVGCLEQDILINYLLFYVLEIYLMIEVGVIVMLVVVCEFLGQVVVWMCVWYCVFVGEMCLCCIFCWEMGDGSVDFCC